MRIKVQTLFCTSDKTPLAVCLSCFGVAHQGVSQPWFSLIFGSVPRQALSLTLQ